VSRIRRLAQSYERFIAVPWARDAAPAQRVIFCVYAEEDELRLRAQISEFELATMLAGHPWVLFDLTNTFAEWMAGQRYAVKYFQDPALLPTVLPRYRAYIQQQFAELLASSQANDNSVVAIKGVGALFGFLKVKQVVDDLAPLVSGRLLIFFPGSYENNNYRLLDGYDGWNYLAVPITADKDH